MSGLGAEGIGRVISEREQRWHVHLAGIAAGRTESLTSLYEESAPVLLGLALRMMRNNADAEEIILVVFEQVWRTAHNFDPKRGSAWRWLTMLVRSRAVDRLRTAACRYSRDHVIALPKDWEPICHGLRPDSASILKEERTLIRSAMQRLPGEQRQALELAYFSGLTHVEIASSLGVPLGTIKTRIRTAVDKLRISLSNGPLAATAAVTQ